MSQLILINRLKYTIILIRLRELIGSQKNPKEKQYNHKWLYCFILICSIRVLIFNDFLCISSVLGIDFKDIHTFGKVAYASLVCIECFYEASVCGVDFYALDAV